MSTQSVIDDCGESNMSEQVRAIGILNAHEVSRG
jgi:hypothetical protein